MEVAAAERLETFRTCGWKKVDGSTDGATSTDVEQGHYTTQMMNMFQMDKEEERKIDWCGLLPSG